MTFNRSPGVYSRQFPREPLAPAQPPEPPPPEGPYLLCPYVLDSQEAPAFNLKPYDSFAYLNGTATCTVSTLDENQYAAHPSFYPAVSGESAFVDGIAPNNGRIAVEVEIESATTLNGVSWLALRVISLPDLRESVIEVIQNGNLVLCQTAVTGSPYDGQEYHNHVSSVGDRLGLVIDTDTGLVDLISEYGHTQLTPVHDLSSGATFVHNCYVSSSFVASTDITTKVHTKASDMQLPYPAGTTDSCLNPVSNVLTAYPLDAVAAEIQAFGYEYPADVDLASQRIYLLTDGSGSRTVGATKTGVLEGTAEAIDLSDGLVGFELHFSFPNYDQGGAGDPVVMAMGFNIINQPPTDIELPLSALLYNNGQVEVAGVASQNEVRAGVLIDNIAGQVLVSVDGGAFAELSGAYAAISPLLTSAVLNPIISQTSSYAGPVNLPASIRLITDPYFFTTPFPPGSVDIAGKAVN